MQTRHHSPLPLPILLDLTSRRVLLLGQGEAAAGAPEAGMQVLGHHAQRLGIAVTIVDRPELSSFITPAIVDRAPLIVAISTGGAAPVLARLIRHPISMNQAEVPKVERQSHIAR